MQLFLTNNNLFPVNLYAYIKGRQANDLVRNTLDIVQRAINPDSPLPLALISMDISGAFDTLSRNFIFAVMKQTDFLPNTLPKSGLYIKTVL